MTIPYMARFGPHREYADKLLGLALEYSEEKYGAFELIQQHEPTVIRRQLLELEKGENLSVAVSMPMRDWLEKAQIVPFPLLKGLASYRMFFAVGKNSASFNRIDKLENLKALKIGQGQGWSTGKILEDNGFQVVYGGPYDTLFPMLFADRFQLLMRGAYEIGPELTRYRADMPDLSVVEGIAIYTYLPMYFFVTKAQPLLAERVQYGLEKAYASGKLDALFQQYFGETLIWIKSNKHRFFYVRNTNIDSSFYMHDKAYLLNEIVHLEEEHMEFPVGVSP